MEDDAAVGYGITLGAMFTENFGLEIGYHKHADIDYIFDDGGARAADQVETAVSDDVEIGIVVNYDFDDQFGLGATLGSCKVTQNHAEAEAGSVDVDGNVFCYSVVGYYKIGDNLAAGLVYRVTSDKAGANASTSVHQQDSNLVYHFQWPFNIKSLKKGA